MLPEISHKGAVRKTSTVSSPSYLSKSDRRLSSGTPSSKLTSSDEWTSESEANLTAAVPLKGETIVDDKISTKR